MCNSKKPTGNWKWDADLTEPQFIVDGVNEYPDSLVLHPGDTLKAKLYRQFSEIKDSLDQDMVESFEKYFLKLKLKTSTPEYSGNI